MTSLSQDSSAVFGSRLLSQVIGFFALMYFARTLGPTVLGVFFTFETLVRVAGIFSKFGVPGAVVKRLSQAESATERSAYLTAAFLLTAVPFAIVSGVALIAEPVLVEYVELSTVAPYLVAVLAANAGNRLFISTLRGERRLVASAGLEFLGQIVRIGSSIALILVGFEVLALVFGMLSSSLAQVLVGAYFVDTSVGVRPTRDVFRRLRSYSLYTGGMEVSNLAYNWADTLILSAVTTKAVVGVYETTWRLSSVTLLTASAIGVSLAPTVTRWHENGEIDRIERAFREALTYAVVLVVPAVVGAAVLGPAVLSTFYDFETGGTLLVVLTLGQVAQAVKTITQNTLFGVDRPDIVFWTNITTLVANVLLTLSLAPTFGGIGAAIATMLTATVAMGTQLFVLRSLVSISADWRALGWQVSTALVMGMVVWFAMRVVDTSTILGVTGLVVLGGTIYGFGIIVHRDMRHRIFSTVNF
jgi:O-antigen/teichoic acid export membrane protein